MLLCDVSGSMVQFSEFALRFIQSLNQASESSRTFLFSEDLFEADAFSLQNMDRFRDYVKESGVYGRGTDLGKALEALCAMRPAILNDATTLLGGEEKPGWGYLRLILGAYSEGSVFHLCSPRIVLGRTHGDIRFSRDAFVSGTHAAIEDNGDSATLTDLDSSNGTFLRITSPVTVNDTLFFLIGNQLMRLMPREEYDNT